MLGALFLFPLPLEGRLWSLEEPLNVAPAPQRRASPSLATEETERGLPFVPRLRTGLNKFLPYLLQVGEIFRNFAGRISKLLLNLILL